MPSPVFARPRATLGPYTDFWRLVECAGYPLIYCDEMDPVSDATYIVTPLHTENDQGWPGATAQIILWDLEWHLNGIPGLKPGHSDVWIPGVARVWASDRWYAQQIGAEFVPLGSHVAFPRWPLNRSKVKYDVAMLAYMDPMRRRHMGRVLSECGVRIAPNSWGEDRHRTLEQTAAMLHIHQHAGVYTMAPLRVAIAAAYHLPLIVETVRDMAPLDHTTALSSDYETMADFVEMWTRRNDPAILQSYGDRLFRFLCVQHDFGSYVEAAL